jgi:transposase
LVGFLPAVVETQPRRRAMHITVDNLSAHKTQQVRTFLVAHPQVHLHYTSTYSSWLNHVELWFSKIERDVTALGIFTSVTDLRVRLNDRDAHSVGLRRPISENRMTAAEPYGTVH